MTTQTTTQTNLQPYIEFLANQGQTLDSFYKGEERLTEIANSTEPISFGIRSANLGRCFNRYDVAVFNYNDDTSVIPKGNCGNYRILEEVEVDGKRVLLTSHEIDSGD